VGEVDAMKLHERIEAIRARQRRLATSAAVPDKSAPAFGTDETGVLLVAIDRLTAQCAALASLAERRGGRIAHLEAVVIGRYVETVEPGTLWSTAPADLGMPLVTDGRDDEPDAREEIERLTAERDSARDDVLRTIRETVEHVRENASALAEFGGASVDEGRARMLAAGYLDEALETIRLGDDIRRLEARNERLLALLAEIKALGAEAKDGTHG
jgi:hypothetical protein